MCIHGSILAASLIIPETRQKFKCYGTDCYAVPFGICTVFIVISLFIFIAGTPFYRRNKASIKKKRIEVSEEPNYMSQLFSCIFYALRRTIMPNKKSNNNSTHENVALNSGKEEKADYTMLNYANWLNKAQDSYSLQLINEVKIILQIIVLFLPLSMFWCLYDQTSSRWTSQSMGLNGRIDSISFIIKPEQFLTLYSVFGIIVIFLLDNVVYPLLGKLNYYPNQMKKIGFGLFLSILAIGCSSFLESKIETSLKKLNPNDAVKIYNLSPCQIDVTSIYNDESFQIEARVYGQHGPSILPPSIVDIIKKNNDSVTTLDLKGSCEIDKQLFESNLKLKLNLNSLPISILIHLDENEKVIKSVELPYNVTNRPTKGLAQIRFFQLNLNNLDHLEPRLENKITSYNDLEITEIDENSVDPTISYKNKDYNIIDYGFYTLEMVKITDNTTEILSHTKVKPKVYSRYTIIYFNHLPISKNFKVITIL
jgi:hypothetical protein